MKKYESHLRFYIKGTGRI